MEKKMVFDSDIENYEKWRPKYCEELFDDIIQYSNINSGKVAIEIGSGTGQATDGILRSGCKFISVEAGTNFAQYLKQKYADNHNFSVRNEEFEEAQFESNSIDLVYAATAFHWISKEVSYRKVYSLLKPGGTIALFWNRPFVNMDNDPLHQKLQKIYDFYRPEEVGKPKLDIEHDEKRYKEISSYIQKQGFRNFKYNIYKRVRVFEADSYISLLNTYSDHKLLPIYMKRRFENDIRKAILDAGNVLRVYDTMDLYLAMK